MARRNAPWMTQEAERILEYLDKHGLATPELISREVFTKVPPGHVEERLQMLEYAELVSSTGLRSYELTMWGALYLRGKLDARHQPEASVKRVLH